MNEIELLKELIKKKEIANVLQNQIENYNNENDLIQDVKDLESVSLEISNLEKGLTEINDKSFSLKAKENMISQFERYMTEINEGSLHLTKNQDTVKNEFFDEIRQDAEDIITDKFQGKHAPVDLKFTNVSKVSFGITELTVFLRNEINILRKLDNANYLKLSEYKDRLNDRIEEQFNK